MSSADSEIRRQIAEAVRRGDDAEADRLAGLLAPAAPARVQPPPAKKKMGTGKKVAIGLAILLAIGLVAPDEGSAPEEPFVVESTAFPHTPGPSIFEDNGLRVVSADWERGEYGNLTITGEVRNLGRARRYAQVQINILDESGAVVGSTLANVNNLEAMATWRFEAGVLQDDAHTFRVTGVSGY